MPRYEYKVVPAPTKGKKARGVKGAEARFSHAIQELMNGLAGYGWEYQRAETLPSLERSGLTSTTTEWRNVLVFRRLRENDAEAFSPELLPAPEAVTIAPEATDETDAKLPEPTKPEALAPEAKPEPVVSSEEVKKPAAETDEPAKVAAEAGEGTKSGTDAPQKAEEAFDNGVEDTTDVKGLSTTLAGLAEARKSSKTDA